MLSFARLGVPVLLLLGAGFAVAARSGRGHSAPAARAVPREAARSAAAGFPLRFEENRGQFDARVRYLARAGGATVFLADDGATLAFHPRPIDSGNRASRPDAADARGSGPDTVITLRLAGGRAVVPSATDLLETRTNYFLGDDPSRWRSNVANFATVTYGAVRPGVDLVFRGQGGRLEYDLVLAPGTRLEDAALEVDGADGLSVDERGDLEIATPWGKVLEPPPRVYQVDADGSERTVRASYRLRDRRIAFSVDRYDESRTLVIDPVVMIYGTYLGGTSETGSANGVFVDGTGSAYVVGTTFANDFPTHSAFQSLKGGGFDAYVAKLNAAGTALVYSTFLGGSGDDRGAGIAVDASGNAYVTGRSFSTNFPTTPSAFQSANAGGVMQAFASKISTDGSSLAYSTYLGPGYGYAVAVDSIGDAHVVGQTSSTAFPTTSGAFATANGGGLDSFVLRVNPSGTALVYSTYLGGSGDEAGYGIGVDTSNETTVVGWTTSSNFPTHAPLQGTLGGSTDAFVTKLNATGTALVYSTYLGGSDYDEAKGVALDASGAYVVGSTSSANFPTQGALQRDGGAGGNSDAFIAKLNTAGAALTYSTYLGGSGADQGTAISVDGTGSAYVTGSTASADFPTLGALQSALPGAKSAFVAKVDPAGAGLVYSTYFGGSASDPGGTAIGTDGTGNAYVTGATSSTDLPTRGAIQGTLLGYTDSFVVKLGFPQDGGVPDAGVDSAGSPDAAGDAPGDVVALVDSSAGEAAAEASIDDGGGVDAPADAVGADSPVAANDASPDGSVVDVSDGSAGDGALGDTGAEAVSGASGSGSGCGCVTSGGGERPAGAVGMLLGAGVLLGRRRRRVGHSDGGQS